MKEVGKFKCYTCGKELDGLVQIVDHHAWTGHDILKPEPPKTQKYIDVLVGLQMCKDIEKYLELVEKERDGNAVQSN